MKDLGISKIDCKPKERPTGKEVIVEINENDRLIIKCNFNHGPKTETLFYPTGYGTRRVSDDIGIYYHYLSYGAKPIEEEKYGGIHEDIR